WSPWPRTILGCVGFDPTRKRTKRRSDYALVAAAFVVVILLLLWALLG
ncbi:MAG: hypothetical protein QOF21_3211, partial [Actinomycetota bacterium]